MQKIVIKAIDAFGVTSFFHRFGSPIMAEMVFHGLSHDPMNQDQNWYLIVDGETINRHCPNREFVGML